ncbi:MAG: two-component system sensor histidine kinase NtrB [Phycisphaerae bacterium]
MPEETNPHRFEDAYYRHLCEHLGVAVVSTDAELNITIWNQGAARMFGASAELMVGTPIGSIFPQPHRQKAAELIGRAFTTGEAIPYEFDHRDDHGMGRELIATFAPVVADSGERVGASAAIRDITRRITIQRELDESRKMAALGTLAGTVAHHFNNLLGGIITSADFAMDSENPVIMKRVLKQVGQSMQRSTALVNGLLAFSGGNQQADDLSDVTETLYHAIDDIEKRTDSERVTTNLDIPNLPIIPFPRVQLTTILKHILANAVEAMPNGGTLTVNARADANYVSITIQDTGHGLDEAQLARVFEPFYTTKTDAAGRPGVAAGLGLAITHGLVTALGGTIAVRSAPGVGTEFRVNLPRPDSTP